MEADGPVGRWMTRVNVYELALYQQLAIYFLPILANMGVINIMVVVVRLYWFEKRLREIGTDPPCRWHTARVWQQC